MCLTLAGIPSIKLRLPGKLPKALSVANPSKKSKNFV